MLTAEVARELWHYDADTGIFLWRASRRSAGKAGHWVARAGERAGYVNPKGYCLLKFRGESFKAHRVAWLYAHGCWPSGEIDHINGDKADNRLCNLRDVTHAVNLQNQKRARADNMSSGLLGVSWHAGTRKFSARITNHGKRRSLGYFDNPHDAHRAYLQAKSEQGVEFNDAP